MPKGIKGFQKGHKQFNTGRTHFTSKGMKGNTYGKGWIKGRKKTEKQKEKMRKITKELWKKGKYTQNRNEKISKTLKDGFDSGRINRQIGRKPWNKLENREPYPYEFNNILKLQIRRRDSFKCQLCNIEQKELNEKLIVHHIDFNKQNNSDDNLISLCRSCHGKINCANKMMWIDFFSKDSN